MIVSTEAELMYPALRGLSLDGLGCGGSCGCKGCDEKKGMGSTQTRDDGSWCGTWPWSSMPWLCHEGQDVIQKPAIFRTTEDIITSTSDYGPALSEESRRRAEQMAREAIEADKRNNPCSYSEMADSNMSELERVFKCGQVNWALWGLVALGGVILLKKI